jgi:glucose-6-phosphate dehydrogenase assembly protein OpcA
VADAVSARIEQVLPGASEVPFADISEALARGRDPGQRTSPARTLTATVVAVCSRERLAGVADAVAALGTSTAVRAILICEGSETRPKSFVSGDTVAIASLRPIFINNAVAALRLSSLPTLVWWSGCSPDLLDDLAHLADRVVMDDTEPLGVWKRAVDFFDRAAFSDLRWTRLTRWRALMAHFFDIPQAREAMPRLDRLDIKSNDALAGSLYGAWLASSIGHDIATNVAQGTAGASVEEVRLSNADEYVSLQLAPSGTCIVATARVRNHREVQRTVPMGDRSDASLLREELRIRVRDSAFEEAVKSVLSVGR